MKREHDTYLVTGGAGFVGASLAVRMKQTHPNTTVIALDNLKRRGSELNLQRLRSHDVAFVHGDIRCMEDLKAVGRVDCIIECSAEASVLAGYLSSPEYLLHTNLLGTINCLEFARMHHADFVMLSTSRVYPYKLVDSLEYIETESRYELAPNQEIVGSCARGISEGFPIEGIRSLYGASKLASELIIQEYAVIYDIRTIINRCGVLTGPWQFGRAEQGFIVYWLASHYWKKELTYIGYGGEGKQVRDILHVDDLFRLINHQLENISDLNGNVYNVGGGRNISVSLKELTRFCREYTGNRVHISKITENRPADIRIYLTDHAKVTRDTGWQPEIGTERILEEIAVWMHDHEAQLEGVLK